jgi:hypothetical protein
MPNIFNSDQLNNRDNKQRSKAPKLKLCESFPPDKESIIILKKAKKKDKNKSKNKTKLCV